MVRQGCRHRRWPCRLPTRLPLLLRQRIPASRRIRPRRKQRLPNRTLPESQVSRCTSYLNNMCCCLGQGADLEVVMSENIEPATFVQSWVTACTAAEGRATTLKAEFLGCISTPQSCTGQAVRIFCIGFESTMLTSEVGTSEKPSRAHRPDQRRDPGDDGSAQAPPGAGQEPFQRRCHRLSSCCCCLSLPQKDLSR